MLYLLVNTLQVHSKLTRQDNTRMFIELVNAYVIMPIGLEMTHVGLLYYVSYKLFKTY